MPASRLRSAGTSANQRTWTRTAIGFRSPAREQLENRPHVAPSSNPGRGDPGHQSSAGQPGKCQPKGTRRATAHSGSMPLITPRARPHPLDHPRRPAPPYRRPASLRCSSRPANTTGPARSPPRKRVGGLLRASPKSSVKTTSIEFPYITTSKGPDFACAPNDEGPSDPKMISELSTRSQQ